MSVALASRPSKVIPAQFRGLARQFRDMIAAEDTATAETIKSLGQRLTVRLKERHDPVPRAEVLRGVAFMWRTQMPPRSRLDLSINLRRKSLAIREVRLSSSVYKTAAWSEHEKGVTIMAVVLEFAPLHYKFAIELIAHVSAHALARRLERGRGVSEADVLADLRLLGQAHGALSGRPDGCDFEIPASDGVWVGTTETIRPRGSKIPGKSMMVRTFLGGAA